MLFKRCPCPRAIQDADGCTHPLWIRFDADGKTIRFSTKTANRKIAEKIEVKRRAAIIEEREGLEKRKTVLLAKHVADYKTFVKAANATGESRSWPVVERFLETIGNRPLHAITGEMIENWKIARLAEAKWSTVDRELCVIKGMFSKAVEWKRLKSTPAGPDVKLFDKENERTRVLSDEELQTFATLESENPFVWLVCQITLETLSRLSEALSIEKKHIGRHSVEIMKKNGYVVHVPIRPELRAAMLARVHPVSGFVFGEGALGYRPIAATASTRVSTALLKLKIKDASHHTFRHTGTTLMLDAGANPKAIQALAGWTSLAMLERYGHARNKALIHAVDSVVAHLKDIKRLESEPTQTPSQPALLTGAVDAEVVDSATT